MSQLALFGGKPAYTPAYPLWPMSSEADLKAVLSADPYAQDGPIGRRFARTFADFCECRYCLPVANGTVSLQLILGALGIGKGDEVILPPYTFIATLSSIVFVGATPVFADIDPKTYNLDVEAARSKITPRTKAIVPVAIGGHPCDFDRFEALCRENDLALIVDAAQAVGARCGGRSIGSYGIAASFSCQNTKNLTAGEGGLITTNDEDFYGRLHDLSRRQGHLLGEMQAALLQSQFAKLPAEIERRQNSAALLDQLLADDPFVSPMEKNAFVDTHAYHLYLFRLDHHKLASFGLTREDYLKALAAEGVPAAAGYMPLYTFPSVDTEEVRRLIGGRIDLTPLKNTETASRLEGGWFEQFLLLEEEDKIREIASAFRKVSDTILEKGGLLP